jgi:urocanate hydratase
MKASASSFIKKFASHPHYKAPTGSSLNAKSWQTEAILRMLLNSLDEAIAQDPSQLIVYSGIGQAARNVPSLHAIIDILLNLKEDESLLIQSGKPVAVLPTSPDAPRLLIATSNLVPRWSNWEQFNELKSKGLIMYGAMSAASWLYVGSQGALEGIYETLRVVAQKHFEGTLAGRLIVSGGLGALGGALPLATTINQGVFLGIDITPQHIEKHVKTRYLDKMTSDYEQAKLWIMQAKADKTPLSVGLVGDISTVLHRLEQDRLIPDVITDQTAAQDPLHGYIPQGLSIETARQLRAINPTLYLEKALSSMALQVKVMLEMKKKGAVVFEYGNGLREGARRGGEKHAFDIPGFFPEYVRPQECEGRGSFLWIALSGEHEDIHKTEEALIKLFPKNKELHSWLKSAREKAPFEGLPARACSLTIEERVKAGLHFNDMVRKGKLKAPIVITRGQLSAGAVASPIRETEKMKDGSDAIADWPLLNLLANCAGGATWVSIEQGGGAGMGYSQHNSMAIVADGTERADQALQRVLWNDSAVSLIRHADAGYESAAETAKTLDLI